MIEINFVHNNKIVASLQSAVVPFEGGTIQIKRIDYIIKKVFWTIDGGILHDGQTLRATIDLSKI